MEAAKQKPLVAVAIYLRGHRLNPNLVSQTLGIKSSRSQEKGGFKPNSKRFIAKIGMWTLKVKSRSRSISDLVDDLLAKIGNPTKPLNKIEGVEEAELDIFVAGSTDNATEETMEFALTENQIVRLSQLGLSMCFTLC